METLIEAQVLVAYATRYGSTQEVAEAVAATLRERGLVVNIEPMREVRTLEGYRSVVLGGPLYMFRWHKDALHFLTCHRTALTQRPVVVFALGRAIWPRSFNLLCTKYIQAMPKTLLECT